MSKKFLFALAGMSFLCASNLSAYIPCCCSESFWIDAEYLYWKIQDSPKIVPLVVQGPVVREGSAVLNKHGTEVVLGDKKINNEWRSGGRFALGYWFNDAHCFGVEGNYFFLPKTSTEHSVCSDGSADSAFLSVPFFDVTTHHESSSTLARPRSFKGKATLKNTNYMQGGELNGLMDISRVCNLNIAVLGGFRYWNFNECLSFTTSSPFVPPNPSDIYKTKDKFDVNNNFYGGQVGVKFDYLLDYACNKFLFNLTGKVAVGAMCQNNDIHGHLLTNDFNGFNDPETYPGGYFAMKTNCGNHKQSHLSVIPEVDFNIGYQAMDCLTVNIGYTFIYASNVIFASSQVNRNINPSQSATLDYTSSPKLVGKAAPKASHKTDGLWVQGISIGLDYKF